MNNKNSLAMNTLFGNSLKMCSSETNLQIKRKTWASENDVFTAGWPEHCVQDESSATT